MLNIEHNLKRNWLIINNTDITDLLKTLKNFLRSWKCIRSKSKNNKYSIEFRLIKDFDIHLIIMQEKGQVTINVHRDIAIHYSKITKDSILIIKKIEKIILK